MISVRGAPVGLAVAFTAYLAARGLWWTEPVPYPLVLITALGLYLLTTWLCIFWEPGLGASGPRAEPPPTGSARPDGAAGLGVRAGAGRRGPRADQRGARRRR